MKAELVSKRDRESKTAKEFEPFDVVSSSSGRVYLVVEVNRVRRFVDTDDGLSGGMNPLFRVGRAEAPGYAIIPTSVTRLEITGDNQ